MVRFAREEAHASTFAAPNALASGFCFVPPSKSPFPCYDPLFPRHVAPLVPARPVAVTGGRLGWLPPGKGGRGVRGDGGPGGREESSARGGDDLLLARIPSCRANPRFLGQAWKGRMRESNAGSGPAEVRGATGRAAAPGRGEAAEQRGRSPGPPGVNSGGRGRGASSRWHNPPPAAPPSPRRRRFGPGGPEPGSGRRLVSVRGERGRAQDARRRRRPAPLPARSQRPRRRRSRTSSSSGRNGSSSRNRRCHSMSGAAAKQSPGAGSATDPAAAEKAAAGDSVPEPPPPLLSVDVTGLVSQFARSFVLIFPVYVLGYLGLSFSWVLIALCGLFWIRRHRGGKTSRLGRALAFLEDEEEAVRLSVSSADLPAWVSGQHPSALPREHPCPAGSAAAGRAGGLSPPRELRDAHPRGGPLLPGLRGKRLATGRSPRAGLAGGRGGGDGISRAPMLLVPVCQPLSRRGVQRRERRCRTWAGGGTLSPPGWPVPAARPPRRGHLVR